MSYNSEHVRQRAHRKAAAQSSELRSSFHAFDRCPRYPFGSIAPYTLNHDGEPIILISTIAQHTRNIKENNKVSLTVFDPARG